VNGIGGFTKKAPRKVAIPSLGPPPERKLIRDEMPPVFLQQNTPVQIWKSRNLRYQRVRNARSLEWNRIGRRIIMCMILIAALAVIWNLLQQ
jgi:hypothetical protein